MPAAFNEATNKSALNCGLCRERGMVRTSTTHATLCACSMLMNPLIGRVECPTVSTNRVVPVSLTQHRRRATMARQGSAVKFCCEPNGRHVVHRTEDPRLGVDAFVFCTRLTGIYFVGNAPTSPDPSTFTGDTIATVYYLAGTPGWTSNFGGLPTMELLAVGVTANPTNGTAAYVPHFTVCR